MKKKRLCVIGVGYLGKFHAEKYAKMDNVDLVGVADIDKNRAEEIAARVGTQSYVHYQDLIGHVDAASIAVPTPDHYTISRDFLKNGIDVLIEKPITTTLNEADDLICISNAKNRYIQVGHLERFNPAVLALDGIIKRPMFIESHRLSTYKERSTDVSVVLDLMIHDIDIISNFVDSEIMAIQAAGIPVVSEHADIANARLEFENGCVANVTASRISLKNERKIRLFQRDAYISVDFANKGITVIKQNEKQSGGLIPGIQIKQLSFKEGDALENELKSFVQSVHTRKPPLVTGQMGRKALKIALNIMEQIHSTSSQFLDGSKL